MNRPVLRALTVLLLAGTTAPVSQAYARASPEALTTAPVSTDPCLGPESAAACTWERTFGGPREDKAYAIAAARDGGLFIAGNAKRGARTHYDGWVLRLDRAGHVTWERPLGGSDDDQIFAMAIAADDTPLLAGHTRSRGRGESDVWIVRLDRRGAVAWERTFGGAGNDRARAATALPNGNFLVAGFTNSKGAGDRDAWVIRLDPDGNVVWERTLGGAGDDGATALAGAADGAVWVAGYTNSTDTGRYAAWLTRLDATDGRPLAAHTQAPGRFAAAMAVAALPDGSAVALGFTQPSDGLQDLVLAFRVTAAAEPLWTRQFGGAGRDTGWAIAATRTNNVVVAAATASRGRGSEDGWFFELDGDGELVWERLYGGQLWDRPMSLSLTPDGMIHAAGTTTSQGAGYEDFWVLRLNAEGRR